MRRRTFLTIAGAGGAIAGVSSVAFAGRSFEDAAVHIIRKELGFLDLEPEGVTRFAHDFAKYKTSAYRWTIRGYSWLGIRSMQSGKVNNLVSTYLLSTDFFRNNMDESKTVKYLALYDPYKQPCSHPFSHLRYS